MSHGRKQYPLRPQKRGFKALRLASATAPRRERGVEWLHIHMPHPLKELAMDELVAKAKMLIRCPATDAFDAFVQPDRITRFWLKNTTGPLGPDAQVE